MILDGQQYYSKYQLPERQQALGYQCYDKYNLTYILHKRVCCKKQYTIDNGTAGSVTEWPGNKNDKVLFKITKNIKAKKYQEVVLHPF